MQVPVKELGCFPCFRQLVVANAATSNKGRKEQGETAFLDQQASLSIERKRKADGLHSFLILPHLEANKLYLQVALTERTLAQQLEETVIFGFFFCI